MEPFSTRHRARASRICERRAAFLPLPSLRIHRRGHAQLVAGAWIYAHYAPSKTARGDVWLWAYVVLMSVILIYATFWGAPTTPMGEARMAVLMYAIFAAIAWLVDRARGTADVKWRTATN